MPKRTETGTWTGVCIAVFTAVLSTTDRRSKKLNCPSVDEQISKTWSIHTMEYDSALKRKGILIPETRRMNPEDIMLSEINVHACSVMCQLFATPWTVARQAPLSVGFFRQEYGRGLPFPSPGDLPHLGIKPSSSALWADSLPTEQWGLQQIVENF